ncbi:I78 family peptidase inhibitor [Microvirga sp. G4-2]|uniref:I78 family peptidase inhibitor n=1 Tax=Microvirga sp. G4-2 TaxID=3434467 RepID=UPI00404485D4
MRPRTCRAMYHWAMYHRAMYHRAMCRRAMRLSRRTQALLASGFLIIAPACGFSQPATAPAQASCAASEARPVVGQPYSPGLAEQARRAAGAREVRKIEPGGAYTMELNPERLNVEVDRAGIVTGVRCG